MDSTSARYLLCEVRTQSIECVYCVYISLNYVSQAYRLGMKYPKYTFLTYGVYGFDWWRKKSDHVDQCGPQAIASVLLYSLAGVHYQKYFENRDAFYGSCYDAIFTLAHALDETIDGVILSPMYYTCSQCLFLFRTYSNQKQLIARLTDCQKETLTECFF